MIDPTGAFAYIGTGTEPGQVVKIDLATFERVDAITLGSGESCPLSAVVDPTGESAYFGTSSQVLVSRMRRSTVLADSSVFACVSE